MNWEWILIEIATLALGFGLGWTWRVLPIQKRIKADKHTIIINCDATEAINELDKLEKRIRQIKWPECRFYKGHHPFVQCPATECRYPSCIVPEDA